MGIPLSERLPVKPKIVAAPPPALARAIIPAAQIFIGQPAKSPAAPVFVQPRGVKVVTSYGQPAPKPALPVGNVSPAIATASEASAAIAAQSPANAARIAWLDKMKNTKPFSGSFVVPGGSAPTTVKVTGGACLIDGQGYQVSKDGRAVLNRSGQIIGEIVAGVLRLPSAAFIAEMKQYGEVY